MTFTITTDANAFLKGLIEGQEDVLGVRLYVENAGSFKAETLLTYCRENTKHHNDHILDYDGLKVYVHNGSLPYLDDGEIGYTDGQMTIKAPRSKPQLSSDDGATVEERINHILAGEINPGLSMHGGECKLVEFTQDGTAVVEFGGGCQGCVQIDVTVKNQVEERLMAAIPEIKQIQDLTDHSDQSNAYFKA